MTMRLLRSAGNDIGHKHQPPVGQACLPLQDMRGQALPTKKLWKGDGNMQTIRVKVPNMLADIYESEQQSILESAIRHVVFNRLAEKRKKYSIANQKVTDFEKRYGMVFKEFVESFPDDADISQPEDWVEWIHYEEVKNRLGILIQKLEQISE